MAQHSVKRKAPGATRSLKTFTMSAPPKGTTTGSDAERAAAAASALDVRVVELEAGSLERFDVIDFNTLQVHRAHLVHSDLQAIEIQYFVGLVGLVFKRHMVLETGTAATHDGDTQGYRHRRLHCHDFLDLAGGNGREIDHDF